MSLYAVRAEAHKQLKHSAVSLLLAEIKCYNMGRSTKTNNAVEQMHLSKIQTKHELQCFCYFICNFMNFVSIFICYLFSDNFNY